MNCRSFKWFVNILELFFNLLFLYFGNLIFSIILFLIILFSFYFSTRFLFFFYFNSWFLFLLTFLISFRDLIIFLSYYYLLLFLFFFLFILLFQFFFLLIFLYNCILLLIKASLQMWLFPKYITWCSQFLHWKILLIRIAFFKLMASFTARCRRRKWRRARGMNRTHGWSWWHFNITNIILPLL